MAFFARKKGKLFIAVALPAFATFALAEESPITRMKADYICQVTKGQEQVAFTLAAPQKPPRAWLGMTGNEMGLEMRVTSFTFKSCPGCYALTGAYTFTGGTNLSFLETVEDAPGAQFAKGAWPPKAPPAISNPDEGPIELPTPPLTPTSASSGAEPKPASSGAEPKSVDCDLPPGMELPPECGGDTPVEPPTDPVPPLDPITPVVPAGPQLQFRYYETSADGSRILFQGTGMCKGQALPSLTE